MTADENGASLRPSVGDLFTQVTEDGRAAVRAEIGIYKAIAAYRLSGVKVGAPMLVGALFLAQAIVTALLVGLILTLSPRLGAGWATVVVVVVALVIVALLGWLGARRLGSLFAPLPPEAEPLP